SGAAVIAAPLFVAILENAIFHLALTSDPLPPPHKRLLKCTKKLMRALKGCAGCSRERLLRPRRSGWRPTSRAAAGVGFSPPGQLPWRRPADRSPCKVP